MITYEIFIDKVFAIAIGCETKLGKESTFNCKNFPF